MDWAEFGKLLLQVLIGIFILFIAIDAFLDNVWAEHLERKHNIKTYGRKKRAKDPAPRPPD